MVTRFDSIYIILLKHFMYAYLNFFALVLISSFFIFITYWKRDFQKYDFIVSYLENT